MTVDRKIKNDLMLTAATVIAAAVVFFIIGLNSSEGDRVEIKQNGKLCATYPLSENRTVKLEYNGGYNLLVIEDGEAYIKEASCPDKLCVNQGRASKNGESLVCLPNKTTVTVISDKEKDTDF